MVDKVVVLYRGALAYYSVAQDKDVGSIAKLERYRGDQKEVPPTPVVFRKEGRHCTGNITDQALMDDLFDAVYYDRKKT